MAELQLASVYYVINIYKSQYGFFFFYQKSQYGERVIFKQKKSDESHLAEVKPNRRRESHSWTYQAGGACLRPKSVSFNLHTKLLSP